MKQRIQLIGYLGRDPEMRYTPSGKAITTISLAVGERYTNRAGERIEKTAWFNVLFWDKLAEIANTYLHKGALIEVWGKLIFDEKTGRPRVYERKDGTLGVGFEVEAQQMLMLKVERKNAPSASASDSVTDIVFDDESEGLPV